MAYGDTFTTSLPTDGQADWGEGALNEILDEIRAVLQAKVTAAGIDLQGDLDFAGNAADDLASAAFRNVSANPPTRGISFRDNELWVTDGAGNSFALTLNGAVNVNANGSITGLAGSNGSVSYSQSDSRFTFLAAAEGAQLEVGQVRLRRVGTSFVTTLKASTGLGADYSVTFPSGTIAGGTGVVTMDSTGQLGVSKDPSLNTVSVAGSASLAGPVTSTSILNAVSIALTGSMRMTGSQFEVNAPTNLAGTIARMVVTGTFVMSGSRAFITRERLFGPRVDTTVVGTFTQASAGVQAASAGATFIHRIDGLDSGDRVRRFSWTYTKAAGAGITGTLGYVDDTGTAHDISGSASSVGGTAGVWTPGTLTGSIVARASTHYFIRFRLPGSGDQITAFQIDIDRPE